MTTKKNYFERNRSGDKWGCDLFLEKYLNTLPFIGNNDGSSSNNNAKATTDVWGQRIRDIDSAEASAKTLTKRVTHQWHAHTHPHATGEGGIDFNEYKVSLGSWKHQNKRELITMTGGGERCYASGSSVSSLLLQLRNTCVGVCGIWVLRDTRRGGDERRIILH